MGDRLQGMNTLSTHRGLTEADLPFEMLVFYGIERVRSQSSVESIGESG
jgi:hypothetical protein